MKKRFTCIAVLASVMLLISSCGNNKKVEDITPDNTAVTLTFSTFYEEGVQADAYKEIIKTFEATHDNIKINLQSGAVEYDNKINSALSSGKGPDIIGLQRSRILEYAKQGKLKDITSWVESQGLKDKLYGVSTGYGKYNGKYYGIGDFPQSIEWFYNVDLFKKAGVEEPKNLDELISACSKLKRYVKSPIMIGAKDPWAVNTFFGIITSQTVDADSITKAFADNDKSQFADLEGTNEAVDAVYKLLKAGAINNSLTNYDYAASIDAFVKGRTAILPMGSWSIEKIEKMKPKGFKYKAFDNPVLFSSNPNSEYAGTSVQVISINAKSKHQKEAMEFLSYLFSEEAQRIFADKNGISSLKSVNNQPKSDMHKQVLKHLELTNEKSILYIDSVSSKMMDSTGSRLLQLINGRLKKATDVWELIVNESHL